ncbi:MAG TPA: cytochrome d ubiquinol oxidase subunit II [Bacteroidales bacterium]|nr:cytochrome d ubiquinol oxidase subunit II [Bacteroidales bacterium]
MTPMISYLFLQQYWWFILSLLGGILVFLMFVQGGQTMLFTLPSGSNERSLMINALGRKWEFTFTTLVVFGGTFFASFPLFYSTSFGGAYWLWTVILFSFIIQAVSYEYRSKAGNIFGQKTFDIFLMINGSLGPFLIGVAVATLYTGANFSLNDMNQVTWSSNWRGLEAIANIRNLALGFAVLFLVRLNGLLFLMKTIDSNEIREKIPSKALVNALFFLVFFLYFVIKLLISEGHSSVGGVIFLNKYKYLDNFIQSPLILILFLAGVAAVLYGIFISVFRRNHNAIWFTGAGTIGAVISLLLVAGYNGTAFYPSIVNTADSLTIENASSSLFTLRTMMFFSFMVPFVIAYIWYSWNALTNKSITEAELKTSAGHKY